MAARVRELSPQSGALFCERWKLSMGVIEMSLWRYIPRPAGLMPIEAMSPPSEVKAPAIPIERAVPNPKFTCERVYMSFDIMPSWSIIRPPNLYCADAVPAIRSMAAARAVFITRFIVKLFWVVMIR